MRLFPIRHSLRRLFARSLAGGGLVAAALALAAALQGGGGAGVPAARAATPTPSSARYLRQVDDLSALWSFYKYRYIQSGKVVSPDEGGITTSEGQSYAMLRAAWAGDREVFDKVWAWTRTHLQIRGDRLFAWKYHGRVLDRNSATDADSDIALALIIAARRFGGSAYLVAAREILDDLWEVEILHTGKGHYVTAGNWAPHEKYPTIHVAYLAPYAYQEFASVDGRHPWREVVRSSYKVLHWIYFDRQLNLPPETLNIDPATEQLFLRHPVTHKQAVFGYDAFPLFWRMAVDARWSHRREGKLRRQMLRFFEAEWRAKGEDARFYDRYTLDGSPLSRLEGLPLYATVQALAEIEDPQLARELLGSRLEALLDKAARGQDSPYYLQNWLWFGRAFDLRLVRSYGEFLGFLQPFDFSGFALYFPWALFACTVGLFFVARYHALLKAAFLALAFYFCARYLHWRWYNSLNFMEKGGPVISVALWAAEAYCFSTVALLWLQVGMRKPSRKPLPEAPGYEPGVDILIPIYSEPLEILEKTLIAARGIRYANKQVHVCDDSHRESVAELAARYGARYIPGPKKHAKAGNLNNAMTRIAEGSGGELVAIFDTDHMPVSSFLSETVPYFSDPEVGFIQTPHHFYNEDIFQRAFGTGFAIPNEQDMFNHAIQGGRDRWGGSFFVGSGAVFRRVAMDRLGGFKLMSITEDIHTSQHLHASGWKSVFVDRDLAVGLTAENLSSYIVQRRRWMLGCLQIFFKDNPLLTRRLGLRHRLGYFASLYYFLFPLPRVIFWATPLYFLLFHLHPIFAEVSVLMAYLLPSMILLPMISAVLLPGWPRMIWGAVYESVVTFPLFRSVFDLLLPKAMGFKVTPKGITSGHRAFDARSSTATLVATGITAFAIGKGLVEFFCSGIEQDAYFFNLAWAVLNLLFLGVALLVAWEHPQRRGNDRVRKALRFRLAAATGGETLVEGETWDLSLGGLAFMSRRHRDLPAHVRITLLGEDKGAEQAFEARVVHNERALGRPARTGLCFAALDEAQKEFIVLNVFASPRSWERAHERRPRSQLVMALYFLSGLRRFLQRPRARHRCTHRRWQLRPGTLAWGKGRRARVLVRDVSAGGAGIYCFGRVAITASAAEPVECLELRGRGEKPRLVRPVYAKKALPFLWHLGFAYHEEGVIDEQSKEQVQHEGRFGEAGPDPDGPQPGLRRGEAGAGGVPVHGVVVHGSGPGEHGDRQL